MNEVVREDPSRIELDADRMRRLGYAVVDMIVDHIDGLGERHVSRKETRPALEELLREPLPEHGVDPDELLERIREEVLGNITYVDHPRFFAYVPGPGNFVGAMADALAAGFNIFAGAWLVASGPAQVELVTIEWLRQICGLPESAGGLFVSGGSMANLTALAIARCVKLGEEFDDGVIYYSDQTHSSIDRALGVLGFAASRIRRLVSDAAYRLDLRALESEIARDRAAGLRPFCVVANAGTTSTGAADPLQEIADFCHREDLWLHVDGAYGAPAVLDDRGRALLAGMEYADSLTLDPHKWLFQPFEIGCVLLRDRRLLRDTFHILPEYLRDSEFALEEVNFRDYGVQLTRGFRALKLWMSLKLYGMAAYREAVTRGIELAEYAERIFRERACWEIVTPAQLGIVTFRWLPEGAGEAERNALNARLVGLMFEDGYAVVSSTVLDGRTVLRLCTINPRTTDDDVRGTIDRLEWLATNAWADDQQ